MEKSKVRRQDVRGLVYMALFMALLAVCAWISIPTVPPFTMQTFGVFLAPALLGGRRGAAAVAGYLLLGLLGAPVFASFLAGPGVLLGPTGGYLVGFLLAALWMWLLERWWAGRTRRLALAMFSGLLLMYAFGTAWYAFAFSSPGAGLAAALTSCVLPFLLPDFVKLSLALAAYARFRGIVRA